MWVKIQKSLLIICVIVLCLTSLIIAHKLQVQYFKESPDIATITINPDGTFNATIFAKNMTFSSPNCSEVIDWALKNTK